MRSGDARHYRFWGQLIRWAARNKSAAGNDDVRMTLSDTVIGESEQVDAMVRWNPERLNELQGSTIKVVATPIVAQTDLKTDTDMKTKTGGYWVTSGRCASER